MPLKHSFKPIGWMLICSTFFAPILSHISVIKAQAANNAPEPKSVEDLLGGLFKDAQNAEIARYAGCRSYAVRRAYRYAVDISGLGYARRANIAGLVSLIGAVKKNDLRDLTGDDLDFNAIHLFNRSVETAVVILTYGARPMSDIDVSYTRETAGALNSVLLGLTANDAGLLGVFSQAINQLGAIENGKQKPLDAAAAIESEITKLEQHDLPTAAELSAAVDGVTIEQAADWLKLLQETKAVRHEHARDKSGTCQAENVKPKTGDAKMDVVMAALKKLLDNPTTQKILDKQLKSLGVKSSTKAVLGSVAHATAAVLGTIALIEQWKDLSTPEKVVRISRIAIEAAMAIQVFLSAGTAGTKMAVLILLSYLLDFIDLGISLFPAGGGKPKGGGGSGDDDNKGSGGGVDPSIETAPGDSANAGENAAEGNGQPRKDAPAGASPAISQKPPGETTGKPGDPAPATFQEAQKSFKAKYNQKLDAKREEVLNAINNGSGDKTPEGKAKLEALDIQAKGLAVSKIDGATPKIDFKEYLQRRSIDPTKDKQQAAQAFLELSRFGPVEGADESVRQMAVDLAANAAREGYRPR